MPKTIIRYGKPFSVRLEPDIMRRIRAGVKRLRPRISITEWMREALRIAAESLPDGSKSE